MSNGNKFPYISLTKGGEKMIIWSFSVCLAFPIVAFLYFLSVLPGGEEDRVWKNGPRKFWFVMLGAALVVYVVVSLPIMAIAILEGG
jgi:hypothetical protein